MAANRRIGVLGVGFGGDVHVPGLRSEGWDVAAIYSRNEQKARDAAASKPQDVGDRAAREIDPENRWAPHAPLHDDARATALAKALAELDA